MHILRFLIFILVISILIFLSSLLLPSRVTVSKSVLINASAEKVSRQIIRFEQWENWYPAFKNEGVTVIKNPPKTGILASVTLKDKNEENIILNLIDSSQSRIDIEIETPSSTKVNYQFIITPEMNNQTQLTWDINADLGWLPWKRIRGIFLDKFSGAQYEAALDSLKKASED